MCLLDSRVSALNSPHLSKKTKAWSEKLTDGIGKGPAQNLSETYTVSEEGKAAIQRGLGATLVYVLVLRCLGGFHRGDSKGSGANCQKVAAYVGWCSSMGQDGCPSDCALSPDNLSHSAACSRGSSGSRVAKCDDKACPYKQAANDRISRLILHGCSFGLRITATLDQMASGLRSVSISGRHVAPGVVRVPPTISRLCGHSRAVLKDSASMGHYSGRACVLNAVSSSARSSGSSGGAGDGVATGAVASIKETPHRQLSRSLEHLQRSVRGHKTGPYDRINDTIRNYLLRQNCNREAEGKAFFIAFTLGFGEPMQMIISTRWNLEQHNLHGLVSGVTDSRWACGPSTRTCHTAALVVDDDGRCVTAAASLSSGENEKTLTALIKGIEDCRPCGPECTHPLVVATEDKKTTTFRRDCPAKIKATPTYNIDKDACAKSAIVKAGGAKPPVDTFHHKQAFSAKLKELRVPDGEASAAINRLHNVTLRAQSQDIKDISIDNMIDFLKIWNDSVDVSVKLDDAERQEARGMTPTLRCRPRGPARSLEVPRGAIKATGSRS